MNIEQSNNIVINLGKVREVETLLRNGVNPNIKDESGK